MDRFPECGKAIDLNLGANLSIDDSYVPAKLRHLVPIVNKWSFADLGDQDVFVSRMTRERPEEIDQLNEAFNAESKSLVREWNASLPFGKHVDEFTSEDWSHPYWQFLNVIKLRETTGGYESDPAVQEAVERTRKEIRALRYAEATVAADACFRDKDYEGYIGLIVPFENLLTSTQTKKLEIAQRKREA